MQVRKDDGTLEAFMPEKVVVSIVKSGAPYKDARSIAESLSKRNDKILESSTIRDHVHSELKSRGHASAIENWENYELDVKRNQTERTAGRAPHARSVHKTEA